jgi:hypothetical protein
MLCPLIPRTHKSGRKTPSPAVLSSFPAYSNLATNACAYDFQLYSASQCAMYDPVTEDELVRVRIDPVFRRQFLTQNLNRLLEALKKMRLAHQNGDTARQIREGVDLAVKLADRLQRDEDGTRAV